MRSLMSGGRVPKRSTAAPFIPAQSAAQPVQSNAPAAALGTVNLTAFEVLQVENVELRRVLIERLGYEALIQEVGGLVRDRDRDKGGDRQLIYIPFEDDEPLMLLKVICPSTGHLHVLRVPPQMRTCHQAAAWIAGFDNPADYNPAIEA